MSDIIEPKSQVNNLTSLATKLFSNHLENYDCTVVVSHEVSDGVLSVSGDTRYVIDVANKIPEIVTRSGATKLLTANHARERLKEAGVPTDRYVSADVPQELDRLMHMLGAFAVKGYAWVAAQAQANVFFARSEQLLNPGALTVTDAFLSAGGNHWLLTRLALACGCDGVYVSNNEMNRDYAVVDGASFDRAILLLGASVVANALTVDELRSAERAFHQGAAAVLTVNAHTDEGGWCRGVIKHCVYPRTSAILTHVSHIFYLYDGSMHGAALKAHLASFALVQAAACSAACPDQESVRMLTSDGIAQFEFCGADTAVVAEMIVWAKKVDSIINNYLFALSGPDFFLRSASTYLVSAWRDEHLKGDVIFPWWFVEPSPILGSATPDHLYIGGLREPKVLKRLDATDVSDVGFKSTSSPNWLRNSGLYYLYSLAYNANDGLVHTFAAREYDSVNALVGDVTTLGASAWIRADCPIPTPMEGADSVLHYWTTGHRGNYTLKGGSDVNSVFYVKEVLKGTVHGTIARRESRRPPRYATKAVIARMMSVQHNTGRSGAYKVTAFEDSYTGGVPFQPTTTIAKTAHEHRTVTRRDKAVRPVAVPKITLSVMSADLPAPIEKLDGVPSQMPNFYDDITQLPKLTEVADACGVTEVKDSTRTYTKEQVLLAQLVGAELRLTAYVVYRVLCANGVVLEEPTVFSQEHVNTISNWGSTTTDPSAKKVYELLYSEQAESVEEQQTSED